MRRTILLFVPVLLALVFVPPAMPAAASRPGDGSLATDVDQALASFWKTLDPCTAHELWVQFTAGTVRDPLGTRPGSFSDVVVELRVLDTCTGQDLLFLSGTAYDVEPNFTRLEQATLDGVAVELSDGTTLVLDLVWQGNDDPTVVITRDGDYQREERFVTAEVSGQATSEDSAYVFTPNDLTSASIHFVRESNVPRPDSETFTDEERIPIELFVFVPCANGGSGELVYLAGSLHVLYHITLNDRGGYHAKSLAEPQGVSGVGLTTGDRYVGTGVTQDQFNGTVGYEFTYINNFRIIGQGKGNNFLVHETYHVTVNANGEVTAYVDNFSVGCR